MRARILAFVFCTMVAATPVRAQTAGWSENGYLGINGIYQSNGTAFDDTFRLTLNQEDGSLTAGHKVSAGPALDIFGGGRVVGLLGLGFGVSLFQRDDDAAVRANLPHPFFFDQPRGVAGSATGLARRERAFHVDAMLLVPVSDAFQVLLFGGPSYISVDQDMVTEVKFSEAYPYDEAQYTGVEITKRSGSKLGYNVGADVCVFVSRHVGVGTLVRFSRANIELPSTGTEAAISEAGGLQLGGGLRVRF
jgi:hypothetical protein